jgi:hypothetical protein
MGQIVEVPSGTIDGINATFFTSVPYQAGSLSVWHNGQEILGCYTETNPATGEFTILAPNIPKAGAWGSDTLAVDFNDPSTEAEIVEVDRIACVVEDGPDLVLASVLDFDPIACVVQDSPDQVLAVVADLDAVAAVVQDGGETIYAAVEDC